jgi:hypothetical protein
MISHLAFDHPLKLIIRIASNLLKLPHVITIYSLNQMGSSEGRSILNDY